MPVEIRGKVLVEIHMMPSGRWFAQVVLPTLNPNEGFDCFAGPDPRQLVAELRAVYPTARVAPVCDGCLEGAARLGQDIPRNLQ